MTPSDIAAARTALGLTQAEMAAMLDIGTHSLSRIECGGHKPKGAIVRLIKLYLAGARPDDWPKKKSRE